MDFPIMNKCSFLSKLLIYDVSHSTIIKHDVGPLLVEFVSFHNHHWFHYNAYVDLILTAIFTLGQSRTVSNAYEGSLYIYRGLTYHH